MRKNNKLRKVFINLFVMSLFTGLLLTSCEKEENLLDNGNNTNNENVNDSINDSINDTLNDTTNNTPQSVIILDSDFGLAGTSYTYSSDTSLEGFSLGQSGENQIWDFSSLTEDSHYTVLLSDPNSNPLFPTANLSIFTPNDETTLYVEKSSSGINVLGIQSDFVGSGEQITIPLITPFEIYSFPLNYSDENNSSTQIKYAMPYDTAINVSIYTINIDSVELVVDLTETSLVDGWGLLKTPEDEYNCLRQYITETQEMDVNIHMSFMGGAYSWQSLSYLMNTFGLTANDLQGLPSTESNTSYRYSYLAKNKGMSVCEISVDSQGNVLGIAYLNK